MISLYPVDFLWPMTQNQEFQTIQYCDYQIEEVIQYIINSLQVGQQVYIYGDTDYKIQLESQYSLSQYGVGSNCVLYVFLNPQQQQNNVVTVRVTIDDQIDIHLQISSVTTINEVISYLKEQVIIKEQITSIEFFDENSLLLATFYQLQLLNFSYSQSFQLKINTQQPENIVPEVVVKITIDNANQFDASVGQSSSINDIILYLLENHLIMQNIISVELLDSNCVVLTTDQSQQLLNFSHIQNFQLKLYTEQSDIPEIVENQIELPNIQDNSVIVNITINLIHQQKISVQDNVTIDQIIMYLKEQGVIQEEIYSSELFDQNTDILLSQDLSTQFLNFPNIQNFELKLCNQYTNTIQNQISIQITIDNWDEQEFQISPTLTINDIIVFLQEQGTILGDIASVELQDQDSILLSYDQSIQFLAFKNISNFQLILYTQQPK